MASTSKRWINPDRVYAVAMPKAHKIKRMTAMVQSMVQISFCQPGSCTLGAIFAGITRLLPEPNVTLFIVPVRRESTDRLWSPLRLAAEDLFLDVGPEFRADVGQEIEAHLCSAFSQIQLYGVDPVRVPLI
jgi:hypothetical protein